jgi:hypothetical protein
MAIVRVRRHVSSSHLDVPELEQFIGKEVEIVVTEVPEPLEADDRFPLRGTLIRDDDPFGPAVPEEDWEALQ